MLNDKLYSIIDKLRLRKRSNASSMPADAELNDLSYEDAILDLEMRSFFRAEYGKSEPPAGVFPRVMCAIRLYNSGADAQARTGALAVFTRITNKMGQALMAAYRLGSHASTGRILSGSIVAAALLLTVMPSVTSSFGNRDNMYGLYIRALSGGSYNQSNSDMLLPVNVDQTGTADISSEHPSVAPTAATGTQAQTTHLSRGVIYEDQRLLVAQRTGEDPTQLRKSDGHTNKQATGQSGNGTPLDRETVDTGYERPFLGQD